MRWKWLVLLIVPLGLLASGCQKQVTVKLPTQAPTNFATPTKLATTTDRQRSKWLADFVQQKLLSKQGIYTTYLETAKRGKSASGHELLSESSGMWLQYLATTKQWATFRQFYRATKKTFDDHGQFSYRYDPRAKKRYRVNATLDDLRIIRALLTYDQMHQTTHYRQEARTRYQTLVNTSIKQGHLVDYYDMQSKKSTTTGSLAYFDFKTLKYFEQDTKADRKYYRDQLTVVKGGYLGDVFPLYAKSYQWTTSTYSSGSLNTSEALETLLHLAEIGQLKATSRRWLIQRVAKRDLENGYTTTGIVKVAGQSAANYALVAMIFAAENDQTHYQQAMQQVWRLQVNSHATDIFGAIGNAKTRQTYSYSNLTALNAALK
ncbi:glycosyl hydrolase family 8 [Lactiplantibacillus nangangensis]|uniref:Glycosyl hydrolase family 8 n=1 Tax=Lactiplantibacillus nangangensis TaxID=2559917 RepID=A0ABW1SI41_9LACO|nr:glycosyl hydrolase family 8 [Lactiplantibacillus nangangensis]